MNLKYFVIMMKITMPNFFMNEIFVNVSEENLMAVGLVAKYQFEVCFVSCGF